jgi:FkbM family methyltransferase
MTAPASLRAALNALLSEDADRRLARDADRFERSLAEAGGGLALFGAGRLGRRALAGLRSAGVEPLAFVDNASGLHGTTVDGILVLSPDDAARDLAGRALVVPTVYTSGPVRRQLAEARLPFVPFGFLARRFSEALLPHGAMDLPHVLLREAGPVGAALDLWADEESAREYVAQVGFRVTPDPEPLPEHLPARDTYFPPGLLSPRADDVFVDCGAYDGDSLRSFLKRAPGFSGRLVGLEPDPPSRARLHDWVATLPESVKESVRVLPFAVGRERGTMRFDATGTAASSLGAGDFTVDVESLDEILAEERPTFLKLDVEGAEEDALHGARRTLERHKPALAICLYHRAADLWRIPLWLASLDLGYRLYLRRHSDECWEQVCYAVPPGRMGEP